MSSHTTPAKFLGNLTGVSFCPAEAKALVYSFEPGTVLRLEREYDNAHDDNAVRVLYNLRRPPSVEEWYGRPDVILDPDEEEKRLASSVDEEVFCGFVERNVAASLARWMDQDYVYRATIKSGIDSKMTPWLLEIEPTGEKQAPPRSYTSLESRNETPNDVGFSSLDDDIPF